MRKLQQIKARLSSAGFSYVFVQDCSLLERALFNISTLLVELMHYFQLSLQVAQMEVLILWM
jgi:hypothetical protein